MDGGAGVVHGLVELVEELQPVGHRYRHLVAHGPDALEVLGADQGLFGDVQPRHDDGDAGAEHQPGGLRVHQDIELGGGGPVAHLDAAPHQGYLGDLGLQVRVGQQQLGHVGQGAGGDQGDGLLAVSDGLGHQFHGGKGAQLGLGLRQGGAVQAGLAVDHRGDDGLGDDGPGVPLGNRDVQPDEGHDALGVVGGLFDDLVAAHRGDSQYLQAGAGLCQYPGDGVVVAGVAVQDDGDGSCHGIVPPSE